MKEVLDGIRANIGAENFCKSCSRDRCRVSLEDVPRDRIVVDADKAFETHGHRGKRCDFILFVLGHGRKLVAAPIELKSGRVDVSDALEQLQEGATFAERFAPDVSGAVCRPILFHGSKIHPTESEHAQSRENPVFRSRADRQDQSLQQAAESGGCFGDLNDRRNALFDCVAMSNTTKTGATSSRSPTSGGVDRRRDPRRSADRGAGPAPRAHRGDDVRGRGTRCPSPRPSAGAGP